MRFFGYPYYKPCLTDLRLGAEKIFEEILIDW